MDWDTVRDPDGIDSRRGAGPVADGRSRQHSLYPLGRYRPIRRNDVLHPLAPRRGHDAAWIAASPDSQPFPSWIADMAWSSHSAKTNALGSPSTITLRMTAVSTGRDLGLESRRLRKATKVTGMPSSTCRGRDTDVTQPLRSRLKPLVGNLHSLVFKTGERQFLSLAGSIPVRLRHL